jgi:hypothetical protein
MKTANQRKRVKESQHDLNSMKRCQLWDHHVCRFMKVSENKSFLCFVYLSLGQH